MYRVRPERLYPPAWRVLSGFVVAPLAAAIAFAVAMPAYSGLGQFERIWRTALFVAVFGAYPTALIFGVPAYFVLRRLFSPRLTFCALTGAVIAPLPWLLLSLMSSPNYASIDGRATVIDGTRTAYGWLKTAEFLGLVGLFGAIAGAVFWALVARGRRSEKMADEAILRGLRRRED